MRIRALRVLVPRHWLVMILVLTLTVLVGYDIKRAHQTYMENATVEFALSRSLENARSQSLDNTVRFSSLITTGDVMVQSLMSPESQRRIRDEGGTADFSFTLVNAGDQEFPNYYYPFAAFSVQSADLLAVHRTLAVALHELGQLLTEQQVQAGVPLDSRISVLVVGDTGPVSQKGSLARSFAALALLATIAISMISNLLDRHRDWLAVLLPWRRSRLSNQGASNDPHRPHQTHLVAGRSTTGRHSARYRA